MRSAVFYGETGADQETGLLQREGFRMVGKIELSSSLQYSWLCYLRCRLRILAIILIMVICQSCRQQNYHSQLQTSTESRKMKANFQINLPSIPGKTIKFKIQDIKSAAFGTQKARFPDNKAILTKKFVESFHNFHETKRDMAETETQAESQMGRSGVAEKEKKEMQFRPMISENKKFLLPIYADIKKEELIKTEKSLQPNGKAVGGYSFAKAGINPNIENEQQEFQQTNYQSQQNYSLTQNYYFTNEIKNVEQPNSPKKPKPSAVFKNETRKRVQDRILFSDVPGPGTYLKDKPVQKKPGPTGNLKTVKKQEQQGLKDYKHLKDVIAKVLIQEQKEQQQYNDDDVNERKELKQDHMFVLDDRDRFGEQIFPIAPKLKVPGPGAYQVSDSIEDKAKKLLLVEEQRKLLKQWFNN